jgi:hypothetical protein
MDEIVASLDHLSVPQYALAFVFVASYALSIGAILEGRGRLVFAILAAVSAVVFAGTMDPWFHGALLVAYAVIGMGLFIGVVWLMSFVLSPKNGTDATMVVEKNVSLDMPRQPQQPPTDAWVG